jgi:hypothetical protein
MTTTQKIELLGSLVRSLLATENDGPRLIAEVIRDERRIYDELDDGTLAATEAEVERLNGEVRMLETRISSAQDALLGLTPEDQGEEE